jgi:signal transduction histidine kinase
VSERRWAGPASFVVLVLLLAATVGGVVVARGQLERRLETVADSAAASVRHDVQLNLQRDVAAAVGLARSLPDPGTMDAVTWRRAVEQIRRAGVFSSLAGVNLFVVTAADELDATLDGLPGPVRDALDLRLADGPVHAIGTAVWPVGQNRPALGYDLFLNADAAPAVAAAARGGTVQSTRPTRVIQEVGEQRATIVYVPVIGGNRVVALISLVFRAEALLTDTVARLPAGAAVRWTDTSPELAAGEALLASVGDPSPRGAVGRDELVNLGRRFELQVVLPPSALGAGERRVPLLVGALGVVLSLGFLVTSTAWRRTAHRADELVAQRTAALAATTAELESVNRELRELDRLKDRVLNTVSHDLRSPLAVINGATELLLDRPDLPVDKQRDLLRRVRRQASRARGLIDELLVAAQLRSGGLVADQRSVDLPPLVDQVISDLGVGRVIRVAEDLPRVLADRVHVERILHNLLTNAANHGRPPVEVSLESGEEEGTVEVQVGDHGDGVPADLREQVFTEFGRSPAAGPGFGLGLAIATELARANGGSLTYREAADEGACFVLVLPAVSAGPAGTEATEG